MVGMTDYTGVSLADILAHLRDWKQGTDEAIESLRGHLPKVLKASDRLDGPDDIEGYIRAFIDLLTRYSADFGRLIQELPQGVEERHIAIVQQILASSRHEDGMCAAFSRNHINRGLKDEHLRPLVDGVYEDSRNIIADYGDLSNLIPRLRTFLGAKMPHNGGEDIEKLTEQMNRIDQLKTLSPFSEEFYEWWRDTEVVAERVFGTKWHHKAEFAATKSPKVVAGSGEKIDDRAIYCSVLERARSILHSSIKEVSEWAGVASSLGTGYPDGDPLLLCDTFQAAAKGYVEGRPLEVRMGDLQSAVSKLRAWCAHYGINPAPLVKMWYQIGDYLTHRLGGDRAVLPLSDNKELGDAYFDLIGTLDLLRSKAMGGIKAPDAAEEVTASSEKRKLGWSIVRQSAVWLLAVAVLECVPGYCACRWGEGKNCLQKILQFWPLFAAVFAASAIGYPFLLGRDRLRLLRFWKGDDK
jgi:hypothetical protein